MRIAIVVLIILAVISVNLLMSGNIIGRAEQSKEMYQIAETREELTLVLGDAGIEKVTSTNPKAHTVGDDGFEYWYSDSYLS